MGCGEIQKPSTVQQDSLWDEPVLTDESINIYLEEFRLRKENKLIQKEDGIITNYYYSLKVDLIKEHKGISVEFQENTIEEVLDKFEQYIDVISK